MFECLTLPVFIFLIILLYFILADGFPGCLVCGLRSLASVQPVDTLKHLPLWLFDLV